MRENGSKIMFGSTRRDARSGEGAMECRHGAVRKNFGGEFEAEEGLGSFGK